VSRHEFDPVSLIAGVLFAAIGLVYLTAGDSTRLSGRAVLAIGVTGLGLAGLAGAIRRLRGPARGAGQAAGPGFDAAPPRPWVGGATASGSERPADGPAHLPTHGPTHGPANRPADESAAESSTLRFSTDGEPTRPASASGPAGPSATEVAQEPADQEEHRPEH
jgi:hypothetical protein